MASVTVYNIEGESVGTVQMPEFFENSVDEQLIHRYFVWVRNQLRPTLAHTKTRGEVRGGGRKPWRQKGTGRARVGSSRSPLWKGGGTVFGPRKEQTWATRMPRTERRKALFSAYASKAAGNNVIIVDSMNLEKPRTKFVVEMLNKLPIDAGKKVLHVHSDFDTTLFASTNNLQHVHSTTIANTNIIDLLNHDAILMTQDTLQALDGHYNSAS